MKDKGCGSLRWAWAVLMSYLRRIRIGTPGKGPRPPEGQAARHASSPGSPVGVDVIMGVTPGGIRYEIRYTPSALAGLLASELHVIGRTIDGLCALGPQAREHGRAAIVTEPGRRDRPFLCLVLADPHGRPLRLIAMGPDERASWPGPSGRIRWLGTTRTDEGADFPEPG